MNDEITTIRKIEDAPIKIFLFSFLKWLDIYLNDDNIIPNMLEFCSIGFYFI